MRYTKEHKSKTRARIIESGYRRFTANGYAATSIDDIMRDCGLTRGGFYAHFKSKSELYCEAITSVPARGTFAESDDVNEDDNDAWTESLLNEYLNAQTAASRIAFFVTDVARRELEVRAAYTNAFKSMSEKIMSRLSRYRSCSEESVLSITAMIIGALSVAYTTDDSALKTKLLAACRENAKALLEDDTSHQPINFFWAVSRRC